MNIWENDTFLARWLNNELSEEERKAFEASEAFAQYQAIIEGVEQYEAPAYDTEEALEQLLERTKEPKVRRLNPRRWITYAAAACILIVFGATLYLTLLRDTTVQVLAMQDTKVDLPDGSSVELDQGSTLTYDESNYEDQRALTLKGKAYFKVEKGSAFSVKLDQGIVSVLGTSFDIAYEDGTLKVNCFTGKVKVEAFGQERIIVAGQSVRLAADRIPLVEEIHTSEPIWLDNIASYQNVPLKIVLDQFCELYELKLEGEYDTSLQYTGQFPTYDLEVAAGQLFGPFKINYQIDSTQKTIQILSE